MNKLLPSTIMVRVYIQVSPAPEKNLVASTVDMTNIGYTTVGFVESPVSIPRAVLNEISDLEKSKEELKERSKEIDERIHELNAIKYKDGEENEQ